MACSVDLVAPVRDRFGNAMPVGNVASFIIHDNQDPVLVETIPSMDTPFNLTANPLVSFVFDEEISSLTIDSSGCSSNFTQVRRWCCFCGWFFFVWGGEVRYILFSLWPR